MHPSHPQPSSLDWLNNLQLPTLNDQQIASLNEPCTDLEITNIIKSLKTSDAPGPDGFTSSYYKKCAPLLVPKLSKLFNHILLGGYFEDDILFCKFIPKT